MEGEGPPPEPLLRLERTDHEGVPHLELVGELDLSTANPLKVRLELIEREEPARIVVDLRRVTFMDSIGLGILLAHLLRGRRVGRELLLVQGSRQIQELFALTGTRDKFQWVPAPS